MKAGAFQFKASGKLEANLAALERGITEAARQGVRLLLTQECALTGYPPLETKSVTTIDFAEVDEAIRRIQALAHEYRIYVALGTVLPKADRYENTLLFLTPDRDERPAYSKRALWGWDADHFTPGTQDGIYEIDGIRVGVRICFEVRFPEYFRELFSAGVQLACVSCCDIGSQPHPARYELIKAHLLTRAVENAMYVLSANSVSQNQTAPTCLINPDGYVLSLAPQEREALISYDIVDFNSNFGRDGRIAYSKQLTKQSPQA